MEKMTAVEWLVVALDALDEQMKVAPKTTNYKSTRESIIKQAKEMEKQQMKSMYVEGSFAKMRHFDGLEYIEAEQYYNETFKDK